MLKKIFNPKVILGISILGLFLTACNKSPSEPAADPNAEIVILSPAGGEKLKVGSTFTIKWKTQGKGLEEVNAVNIELSPDSGITWKGLLTSSISMSNTSEGKYDWVVPGEINIKGVIYPLTGKTNLLLKVMQYSTSDNNKIAISKKTFSIVSP